MTIVSVYAVFANRDEAERIGRTVVEEGLAACINIFGPCRSIYRWNGKVESEEEIPAILKSTAGRVDSLVARIAELHGYETPCITVGPIDKVLESYADWVEASVG